MGTFTSTGSGGNWTDDSTWAETGQPAADGTDHCIISAGDTVTLTGNTGTGSIKISGTIVGGGHTLTVNKASSNKPFDHDGVIDSGSDLNVTITNTGAQQDGLLLDATPNGGASTGNINNLTINLANGTTANKTIGIAEATTIDGDLTITSGTLNTSFAGGTAADLTVAGALTNNGTLTLNDSTVNLGSTSTEAGDVTGSGTFNLDTSTINYHTAGGANFIPSTSANFDTNTSTFNLIGLNGSNRAHNFTFASGNMHNITTSRGAGTDTHTDTLNGNCTITGNLTVGANSNFSTGSRVFTVNGDVDVTGQLISNGSDKPMTFKSLTIASAGTYTATSGTTTINGDPGGYPNFGINIDGTFTHNNGTLKYTGGGGAFDLSGTGNLYNFEHAPTATTFITTNTTIENNLTMTGANFQGANGNENLTVKGNVTINSSAKSLTFVGTSEHTFGFLTILDGTYKVQNDTGGFTKVGGIRNVGGTVSNAV